MTSDTQTQLKEESLRWIFSILSAILVYVVVACIAKNLYHPDTTSLKQIADELLSEPGMFRAEPMEALLFRLGVFTIVPAILVFYMAFSKTAFIKTLASEKPYVILSVTCILAIAGLVYFDFASFNPFGPHGTEQPQMRRDPLTDTNFNYFFDDLFLGSYLWLYALIIVPATSYLFFVGFKKNNWDNKEVYNKIIVTAGYILVGSCITAVVLMNTYAFPYSDENKCNFSPVYYSMTQVYSGSPMLVDHFTNTYGLYPHFLNIIFQVTGLSIFKFSLVMSLLIGTSFLLNFLVLEQFVRNKVILFLGFATILFFPYIDYKITAPFDSVFASYPIRYIIPSTIAYLTSLYLKDPSQKKYWLTFFTSATFILWNPEMGMVCYMAWLTFNIYRDFYTPELKINKKKILFHLLAGAGAVVASFYTYKLLIFCFYGAWPDLSMLFKTILIFSKIGFGLLPMSLVYPWNLTALVLILGFTWAITKWLRKEVSQRSSIVLMISIIGLGYFVYFQGRSHNTDFAISSGFCLILLTILGDELWNTVKNTNVFLLNALFVVFLFFISFSLPELLYNSKKIVDVVYQESDRTAQVGLQQFVENNEDFIIKNSKEHEKIHVFTLKKLHALEFNGNKRVSAHNPGPIDLFLKEDNARLQQLLVDSSFSVFAEESIFSYPFLAPALAAFAASYECIETNQAMALFKKRTTKVPLAEFFANRDQAVVHRKYTDDKAGINWRIKDAQGIDSVSINPVFSVEALFYSSYQPFKGSVLIGNSAGTTGFGIGGMRNSTDYFFIVNGNGIRVAMPFKKWNYVVMNVSADRVEVYNNGKRILSVPPKEVMRPSTNKLHVGMLPQASHFIGPISEISVANKVLDSTTIFATWKEIERISQ